MSGDPVLIALMAKRSRNSKRTYWQRIGCAYPHESGAGLTVLLDLMPLDGKIVLLEPDEKDLDWVERMREARSVAARGRKTTAMKSGRSD